MPRRPELFVQQQIIDLISSHQAGDMSGAARIQRKLAQYYSDRNDQRRARSAALAAAQAEAIAAGQSSAMRPVVAIPPGVEANPSRKPLAGNYFGFEGKTLHTWEFHDDGNFLHTWIASGSGTSVRNSERGHFQLEGATLRIEVNSTASGFTTPGVGRSTLSGGDGQVVSEVRRLTIDAVTSQSMVLDGITFKRKSW